MKRAVHNSCITLALLMGAVVHQSSCEDRIIHMGSQEAVDNLTDVNDLENKKFDFLIFAQIWPITSCDIWESEDSSNTCFLPKEINGRWTVHGIWPSTGKGMGPFNCNTTVPFNPSALDPIMSKLNIQWTDVHENGPKEDFWKHEWTKHGTCAMQLKPLDNELKYFSQGLDWNNKFDISTMLSGAGIVPGKGYTGQEIQDKLTRSLGKRPGIECVRNKKGYGDDTEDKLLLSQVEICIDKTFGLIDCKTKSIQVCSPDEPINYYPKTTHRRLMQMNASSPSMIVGIVAVVVVMLIAAVALFFCYRRNRTRYRGYEDI